MMTLAPQPSPPPNSRTTKKELHEFIKQGWSERRARVDERRKRDNECTKRWKACEDWIDKEEARLGRTLSVREYYNAKVKFNINPYSEAPHLPLDR